MNGMIGAKLKKGKRVKERKREKERAIEYVTVYCNAKIDMSRKLSIYWPKWKLAFKSQNTLRVKALQSNRPESGL